MATHTVLSPLPGTFYRSGAPGQPAFKNDGDTVNAGDVIGIVEVMKQFSEVTADVAGRIVKFHLENESPVDAGAPLVDIETA
ncbi:MAG: acetyl-CoA carboxylase [Acidovorax sp.]|nr:acetyl-CoA carboxylase [Acidovorax sp.]